MAGFHIDMNEVASDDDLPYRNQGHYWAYLHLRGLLVEHIANRSVPLLHETAHPTGGVHWSAAMQETVDSITPRM
jgi:hypothetical protein